MAEPQPSRSESKPLGLSILTGEDLLRVSLANECYFFTLRVAFFCFLNFTPFWIGNPHLSYMWMTAGFVRLMARSSTICFDACTWGGARRKRQRLVHFGFQLDHVGLSCDSSHEHLAWGKNEQDSELQTIAYPKAFSVVVASATIRAVGGIQGSPRSL